MQSGTEDHRNNRSSYLSFYTADFGSIDRYRSTETSTVTESPIARCKIPHFFETAQYRVGRKKYKLQDIIAELQMKSVSPLMRDKIRCLRKFQRFNTRHFVTRIQLRRHVFDQNGWMNVPLAPPKRNRELWYGIVSSPTSELAAGAKLAGDRP